MRQKNSQDNSKTLLVIQRKIYPWLDENDPRRHMTDKEILENTIDLSEACITERQSKLCTKFY